MQNLDAELRQSIHLKWLNNKTRGLGTIHCERQDSLSPVQIVWWLTAMSLFFLMLHISMCTVHKTVKFWKCHYTKSFYQQDIFAICNISRCSLGSVTQGSVFNDTLCLSHQLLTFYGCLKTSILQEQPICSWRAPIEINRAPMIPLDGGLRNTLLVFCTETLFKEDNSIHSQNPQAEHFFLSMAGG